MRHTFLLSLDFCIGVIAISSVQFYRDGYSVYSVQCCIDYYCSNSSFVQNHTGTVTLQETPSPDPAGHGDHGKSWHRLSLKLLSYCRDFFRILVVASPGPYAQTFFSFHFRKKKLNFLRIFFINMGPMGAKISKRYSYKSQPKVSNFP